MHGWVGTVVDMNMKAYNKPVVAVRLEICTPSYVSRVLNFWSHDVDIEEKKKIKLKPFTIWK